MHRTVGHDRSSCRTRHHAGSVHICAVQPIRYCTCGFKIGDVLFCLHPNRAEFCRATLRSA